VNRPSTNPIIATTLVTSDAIRTSDLKKMSFFINYDETETVGSVQGTFTAEVSWDKSNWYTTKISELDFGAADTPDTSIVLDADKKTVAYFDQRLTAPWVRVKFSPEGADGAGDFIYVTIEFNGIQ